MVLYPNKWYYITRHVIKGLHCTCMTNYMTVQITQSLSRIVLLHCTSILPYVQTYEKLFP